MRSNLYADISIVMSSRWQ